MHVAGCPKEADPRNESCDCARLTQPEPFMPTTEQAEKAMDYIVENATDLAHDDLIRRMAMACVTAQCSPTLGVSRNYDWSAWFSGTETVVDMKVGHGPTREAATKDLFDSIIGD